MKLLGNVLQAAALFAVTFIVANWFFSRRNEHVDPPVTSQPLKIIPAQEPAASEDDPPVKPEPSVAPTPKMLWSEKPENPVNPVAEKTKEQEQADPPVAQGEKPLNPDLPDIGALGKQITPPAMTLAARSARRGASLNYKVLRPGTADPIKRMGDFITSLAEDGEGRIWIGTEDFGVWCHDPSKPDAECLKHFGTNEGLIDEEIYAVACDLQGRVWAGHCRSGVSVLCNGVWKNYSRLDGPLGERIFKLKVSLFDGSVWMATSAGLTRYDPASDKWTHFTKKDGLSSNQIQTLDIGVDGTVLVGTQCDGINIAMAADNYAKWTFVEADDTVNFAFTGAGLGGNLINDVLIARDGTFWVAACNGISKSGDRGKTWTFYRGFDFKDKIKINYKRDVADDSLLLEDYSTTLAEDSNGMIWVGHRQKGPEILDPKEMLSHAVVMSDAKTGERLGYDYQFALLAPEVSGHSGDILTASYGSGFFKLAPRKPGAENIVAAKRALPPAMKHPSPIPPPTEEEVKAIIAKLTDPANLKNAEKMDKVTVLDDDWTTRGDWLGRHGTYWACLCAWQGSNDFNWGLADSEVWYHAYMGKNRKQNDSLHYWMHWLYTSNPKCLELPQPFLEDRINKKLTEAPNARRQAEWDDGGEDYSMCFNGPNVYVNLQIPRGDFVMALYDFNKDGHTDKNRYRDYLIRIYQHDLQVFPINTPIELPRGELAHARVRDFWGGVYKQFLIQGPIDLTVELDRNHSFNGILAAVMLQPRDVLKTRYFHIQPDAAIEDAGRQSGGTWSALSILRYERANRIAPKDKSGEICAEMAYFVHDFSIMERILVETKGTCGRIKEKGLKMDDDSLPISRQERRFFQGQYTTIGRK